MVDTKDCVGCSACEVACKQEHNLPVGIRLLRVFPDSPREIEDRLQFRYVAVYCMHCSQPQCRDACPAGAVTKREDGIVLIDEELCTGCKECIEACPLGIMQFDEEKGVAEKCDLCVERVEQGLQPACVVVCPSHCVYFGDTSRIAEQLGEQELLVRYKGVVP